MEKLTAEQIIEVLQKNNISDRVFGYMEYSSIDLGLGVVEEVEQKGGEGEGESWYSVQYFKEHNVYLRIDAFYTSYDGCNFDDSTIEEVHPIEKTITVYE